MISSTRVLGFVLAGGLISCAASSPVPPVRPAQSTAVAERSAAEPSSPTPTAPPDPTIAEPAQESPVAREYGATAQRIREAALGSDAAYRKLAELTDRVGPRLSGSPGLQRAVNWAKETLTRDGHDSVTLEPVKVPHWLRGGQEARILAPIARELPVLALGGSVPTPAGGLTAELLVVSSFQELEARQSEAKGKIVLLDHPMSTQGSPGLAYGEAIGYRTLGAARAAPFGAVAVLVRSLTTRSLGTIHTGSCRYPDPKTPKIPSASLSVEDAELLHRLAGQAEKVRLHLALSPQLLPDASSANVLAEIKGRQWPEQIVLIGAHLDSWDVSPGAQDDGAGVVTVMQALTTLRALGLAPRRTLRLVLFTNEENGLRGATQYALDHRAERHVAAFEMDTGAGAPLGFMTDGEQPYAGEARAITALLKPLGAGSLSAGFAGEDVQKLKPAGAALFGLQLDIQHYFDVHHSAADTLDKVDPENLKKSVAAMATLAFIVADQEQAWDAPSSGFQP